MSTRTDAEADAPVAPGDPGHDEWLIDEAIEETFPASDPATPPRPGSTLAKRYESTTGKSGCGAPGNAPCAPETKGEVQFPRSPGPPTHRGSGTAPAALATPSGFSGQAVAAVAGALNVVAAESCALFIKTKNYHWHVTGPHFRDYHELLEEQARSLLGGIDPLAECVRRIGGTTLRSIGHIAGLSAIADDEEDLLPAEEMVRRLLEDNRRLAGRERDAIAVCERHGDAASAGVLQQILDQTEKRIRFLHALSCHPGGG